MVFDLEQIGKQGINPLVGMSKHEIDRLTSDQLAEIVVDESLKDMELPKLRSSLCFWAQIENYVQFGYWNKVGPAEVEKVTMKNGPYAGATKDHIVLTGPSGERFLLHDDNWETTEWKFVPDLTTVDIIRLRDLANSDDVDTVNKMGLIVSKLCIHIKEFCEEYARRRGLEYKGKKKEGEVFRTNFRYDDVAKKVLRLIAYKMNVIN